MTGCNYNPNMAFVPARPANGHDAPRQRLALTYLDRTKPRTDSRHIVKGIVNAGEFGMTTGISGCGKTNVVTDIGLNVASGIDWRGFRVHQTGVVIVAAEGGTAVFDRVEALQRKFNPPAYLPLAVIADSIDFCHDDDDAKLLIARMDDAAARFQMPIGLVIVDTLSRAIAGGDENSPQDIGGFVRRCDLIRDRTGAHLNAVHHLGKDLARGARGHSMLRAAVDTELTVTRDEVTKVIRVTVDKQRNSPCGAEVALALKAMELGTDQDGDPVTGCIVVTAEPQPAKATAVKLSPS